MSTRARLTLAMLACFSTAGWASDTIVTKVANVGTYGDGRVFVWLATTVNEPGCPMARFDVEPTTPGVKNVLAVALMAMTTDKPVAIRTSGCIGPVPKMDGSTSSYFYTAN